MTEIDPDTVMRLLRFCAAHEIGESLQWNIVTPDGHWAGRGNLSGRLTAAVGCSDMFSWATADSEEITPETIEEFERAVMDAAAVDEAWYGPLLYCCRRRRMRPQGAAYPKREKLWPLLDACGPERETDSGNPKPHPRYGTP